MTVDQVRRYSKAISGCKPVLVKIDGSPVPGLTATILDVRFSEHRTSLDIVVELAIEENDMTDSRLGDIARHTLRTNCVNTQADIAGLIRHLMDELEGEGNDCEEELRAASRALDRLRAKLAEPPGQQPAPARGEAPIEAPGPDTPSQSPHPHHPST